MVHVVECVGFGVVGDSACQQSRCIFENFVAHHDAKAALDYMVRGDTGRRIGEDDSFDSGIAEHGDGQIGIETGLKLGRYRVPRKWLHPPILPAVTAQ